MIDDEIVGAERIDPPPKIRLVSFNKNVDMGQVLIFLGMLASATVGLIALGGKIQGVQDAIAHESELRIVGEKTVAEKLADVQTQEARDISNINQSIISIRDDIRTLVSANPVSGHR